MSEVHPVGRAGSAQACRVRFSAPLLQVCRRWRPRPARRPVSANLPPLEVIAQEIVDDLESALEQFAQIAKDLK
jgi:hypothetical protein